MSSKPTPFLLNEDDFEIISVRADRPKIITGPATMKQILENQAFKEKFEQYLTEGQLNKYDIDTVVCSKEVFESNKEKAEKYDEKQKEYEYACGISRKLTEENKRLKEEIRDLQKALDDEF